MFLRGGFNTIQSSQTDFKHIEYILDLGPILMFCNLDYSLTLKQGCLKFTFLVTGGVGYLIRGLGHKIRCLGRDFRNFHCFDLKTLIFNITNHKY